MIQWFTTTLSTTGYLFESVGPPDPDAVVLIVRQGGHRVVLQGDWAVPVAGDTVIFCNFGFMIIFSVSMIEFVMLKSHVFDARWVFLCMVLVELTPY